jgi:hypothetical protein
MKKKINIIQKIFLRYILWCGVFCVQFIEGAAGPVRAFKLSDGRGEGLLGGAMGTFDKNCNVLECEGIKYVNWFFPINTLEGYQHFFDVYCRKAALGPGELAEILRGNQRDINTQKILLGEYIIGVQNYLATMSKFYQDDSPWMRRKDEALGYLRAVVNRINGVTNVDELDGVKSRLREAGSLWPCMHTEPICVYDKWNENNVIFSENPYMRSYLKPCSMTRNNWNCLEMLEAVARQIGQHIEFGYYH